LSTNQLGSESNKARWSRDADDFHKRLIAYFSVDTMGLLLSYCYQQRESGIANQSGDAPLHRRLGNLPDKLLTHFAQFSGHFQHPIVVKGAVFPAVTPLIAGVLSLLGFGCQTFTLGEKMEIINVAAFEAVIKEFFNNEILPEDITFSADFSCGGIKIFGDRFHGSLTTDLMKAIIELETSLKMCMVANGLISSRDKIDLDFKISDNCTELIAEINKLFGTLSGIPVKKILLVGTIIFGAAGLWYIDKHLERTSKSDSERSQMDERLATAKLAEEERLTTAKLAQEERMVLVNHIVNAFSDDEAQASANFDAIDNVKKKQIELIRSVKDHATEISAEGILFKQVDIEIISETQTETKSSIIETSFDVIGITKKNGMVDVDLSDPSDVKYKLSIKQCTEEAHNFGTFVDAFKNGHAVPLKLEVKFKDGKSVKCKWMNPPTPSIASIK
jgi:phosphatidylglycerophosphatase A